MDLGGDAAGGRDKRRILDGNGTAFGSDIGIAESAPDRSAAFPASLNFKSRVRGVVQTRFIFVVAHLELSNASALSSGIFIEVGRLLKKIKIRLTSHLIKFYSMYVAISYCSTYFLS